MLVFFYLVGTALAFDQAPTLDPSIPTVSPHISSNPDSCVGQCAFSFIDNIRSQLGSSRATSLLQLNYNDFLASFSNTTFFENFCTYPSSGFHKMKCEPGYLHQLLMRSSEIIDHYCVYNFEAIREKFPCLEKVTTEPQCIKTCTSHHDAVNSLINNFRHLAMSGDTTRAEQYLGESCEYVTCTLHCDIPAIAHTCGFPTAELVIDLTQRSFGSMEKMALDTNAVTKWPKECADIKTYRLPKPVAPPAGQDVVAQSSGHGKTNVQDPTVAALVQSSSVFHLLSAIAVPFLVNLL